MIQQAYLGKHTVYVPKMTRTVKSDNKENKRRYTIWVLAFMMIAAVSTLISVVMDNKDVYAASLQQQAQTAKVIIVEPGDTLWSIAAERRPDDRSIQEFIYEIKKANGLKNSSLNQGQKLILP